MALIGNWRGAADEGEEYNCAFYEECGQSVVIYNDMWDTKDFPEGWIWTRNKKFHCPTCANCRNRRRRLRGKRSAVGE